MAFLAAGMIVFWITTFVFVFSIMRRERRLEEEVAMLREVVVEEQVS